MNTADTLCYGGVVCDERIIREKKEGATLFVATFLCNQGIYKILEQKKESVMLIPFFKTFFICPVQFPASIRQDLQ